MRALAGSLALPADTSDAVDNRRFLRSQAQVERDPFTVRVEHMRVAIGLYAPIVDPDRQPSGFSPCFADPGAGDLFHEVKLTACLVRDGEMSHLQLAESQARGILGFCPVRDGWMAERG